MELPNEKTAAAARLSKRRLENPLTEAQKAEKAAVEAERIHKIQRTAERNSERLRVMGERRSAAGDVGLVAEASRNSTRRKLHPLTVDEKAEKVRVETERRNAAGAEFLAVEAARKSARRKTNPLTAEQKAKNCVANDTRYRKPRLTVEQKAENVRIEIERRNAESSQAASIRLLDKRHRYATRSATVVDSVLANALVSNNVLNVQPKSDPVISCARTARASREVQSDAQKREVARARANKWRQQKLDNPVNYKSMRSLCKMQKGKRAITKFGIKNNYNS